MAKNYFNRYIWLIDTINRYGHIPREEISRLWERSPLNETGEELYERTFHNHRTAILETFGIEIKCDRSLGYYIANSDDLEGNGLRQWLLESLSLNNLMNESSDMRDRILFEKIPSSRRWLPVFVNAMRDGKAVEITYQSFRRDAPNTFTIHPYCLKLFKQRWFSELFSTTGSPYRSGSRSRPARSGTSSPFRSTTRRQSSNGQRNTASSTITSSRPMTSVRKSSATGRIWRSLSLKASGTRSRRTSPGCIKTTDYDGFRGN